MRNLIVYIIILCLYSCTKDRADPFFDRIDDVVTPMRPNYILSVGSFWVYTIYKIDSSGKEIFQGGNDTVRIIKDSIVNGKAFSVFQGQCEWWCNTCFFLRRDSSGYLVDEKGEIFCSFTNFADTFEIFSTSSSFIVFKMANRDSLISVPAGNFIT